MKTNKINLLFAAAAIAAALACSDFAHAGGNHTPSPAPSPSPSSNSKSYSGSSSKAGAVAGAKAGAVSGSTSTSGVGDIDTAATGVGVGQGGGGGTGGSVQDHSQYSSHAWSLFLPPPVFTPPMPRPEVPQGCPAPSETQDALQIAGPIFSSASSRRDNSPCVAIRYSQILWDRCQYQKADRILAVGMKKFAREVGEDWDAQADPSLPNYTLEECGVLRKYAASEAVRQPVAELLIPPQQPQQTPPPEPKKEKAACTKGQRRNSKGVCYTPVAKKPPCPEGQVLACVKRP